MKLLKKFAKVSLMSLWFVIFRVKAQLMPILLKHSGKYAGFYLGLHVSIIQDLIELFDRNTFNIYRWSISSHNFVFRKLFRFPDPVSIVNNKNWQKLDRLMIKNFSEKYSKIFSKVDFFVVTHTPSFIQLYKKFDKPILCINSTRYEAPYTLNLAEWKSLNSDLYTLQNEGRLTIWSNNRVDRDYLFNVAAIESDLVPSLCSYVNCRWNPNEKNKLLVYKAKTEIENEFLKNKLGKDWLSLREGLGEKYKFEDLSRVTAVFFLPYQLSTMLLFELATMGVPVIVPSPILIKRLILEELPLLNEVLWASALEVNSVLANILNDTSWIPEMDWWLERADFYDPNLMPNVILIDDLDDLQALDLPRNDDWWRERTELRNQKLKDLRQMFLEKFLFAAQLKE